MWQQNLELSYPKTDHCVRLQLYHEAWKQPQVLQGDVAAAAEYVWTSGKSLKGGVLDEYVMHRIM